MSLITSNGAARYWGAHRSLGLDRPTALTDHIGFCRSAASESLRQNALLTARPVQRLFLVATHARLGCRLEAATRPSTISGPGHLVIIGRIRLEPANGVHSDLAKPNRTIHRCRL